MARYEFYKRKKKICERLNLKRTLNLTRRDNLKQKSMSYIIDLLNFSPSIPIVKMGACKYEIKIKKKLKVTLFFGHI